MALEKDHEQGTIIVFDGLKEKLRSSPQHIKKMLALSFKFSLIDKEFIIHVKNDYDYRFISDQFQEIKECIKYLYHAVTSKNLPIYKVANSKLKEYETTKKDLRNSKDIVPEEKYLDASENIYPEG